MSKEISPHIIIPEPKLMFHHDRQADQDVHPLRGLIEYGPYSSTLVPDPIRLATISPAISVGKLRTFLNQIDAQLAPKERRDYLPSWPGCQRVYGLRMRLAEENCHVRLDSSFESSFERSQKPHSVLVEHLVGAIHRLQTIRSEFDVLVIYIPSRWAKGRKGGPQEDFDLHDHLKAFTASIGLPIQLVEEEGAISYGCQASVMWRLSLALYVKAGGVPWKLAETEPETAYIGISYAMRRKLEGNSQFITCCSQVFDAEGSGIEFIAYDTTEYEMHRKNPFLSRADMFRVMTRSMEIYRRRHAGRSPRRVMVHKNSEFRPEEIEGCMEAFHLCEAVDLVQIVQDVAWRGVLIERSPQGKKKGIPAAFPVARGTTVALSPYNALLWTHGDVKGVTNRSYFKGSRSTPVPIRLVRHAGHGTWDDTVRAILGLTKMNWNNDSLYDLLPVTMSYAQILARTIRQIPTLKSTPYPFRLFM